jgi:hypothetical protein
MNSIAMGGYISTDAENLKRGYRKPFVVIAKIPNHRNGHAMGPNRVALKYLDLF